MARDSQAVRVIARNRRARHDYEIVDVLECGIALVGTEVKSLRAGRASIGEAYGRIKAGELFVGSVPGAENGADLGTKVLDGKRVRQLSSQIGLGPSQVTVTALTRMVQALVLNWLICGARAATRRFREGGSEVGARDRHGAVAGCQATSNIRTCPWGLP